MRRPSLRGFSLSGRRNQFAAIRIDWARKVLLWPQISFRKPRPPAGKRGFFLLRIRRIVKGCAAYRSAVITARFRAATINNLARASLALVLRALFGAPKSCALLKLCMVCPHGRLVASRARPNSVPDHGHLMARLRQATPRAAGHHRKNGSMSRGSSRQSPLSM